MTYRKAIGLMSGTSMDGIDVALIETDGEQVRRSGKGMTFAYGDDARELIRQAMAEAEKAGVRPRNSSCIDEAEDMITRGHAQAVKRFAGKIGLNLADVDVIGFHGQTILHRPDKGYTVQLGNGQLLADLTGVEVVYDFRSRDVLAGGQGAPLAPAYHRALARAARLITPLVIVNIGGISNVTWVGRGGEMLAFDAGPGNALLDDWVQRYADQPMDRDGRMAQRGTVDESAVTAFMGQDYFSQKPPKSLDRHDFSAFLVEGLGPADGAATLTAITTEAIARAVDHMPKKPVQWVISGGGALNPVMMKMLKSRLKGRVDSAQALGWSVDYMEAEAFAFLAVRSCYNLPITFPGTTGVLEPMTGGVRVRPAT